MLCMNQSHTKIYVHGNAMGLTHYKNSRCVMKIEITFIVTEVVFDKCSVKSCSGNFLKARSSEIA